MSDTHSNAPEKLSDLKLEHLSHFDWNRCPICFRTCVRHELESLSDLACSTHLIRLRRHSHPIVTIESAPFIAWLTNVVPVSVAEVSPHLMPVSRPLKCRSRSRLPSPSTSRNAKRTAAASVPVG